MSTFDVKGCLTYKDKDGNLNRLFPATKRECIDGLDYIDEHIANADNPHGVKPLQIGAIPIEDIATVEEVRAYLNEQVETPADEQAGGVDSDLPTE